MVTHLLLQSYCVSVNRKKYWSRIQSLPQKSQISTEAHGIAQDAQESLVHWLLLSMKVWICCRKLLMMSWLHNIWQNQATCIVCPIIGHRQGMLKCIFHVWKSKQRDKYRCCHASGSQTGDRTRNWRNTKRSPSRSCQNAARSAQHIERIASDIVIIPVCKICCPQPGRISRWSFKYHVNIIKYQYPYQCIDCTYIYI